MQIWQALFHPPLRLGVDVAHHGLILKPTDLGSGKLKGDYEVLDEDRRSIGRIMLHPQAPSGRPWFWTITARVPQLPHDRGYAESREQSMADFKTAWERKSVVLRRM